MLRRCLAAFFEAASPTMLTVVLTLMPAPAAAQTGSNPNGRTMPMRTPDGQPDVSGTFTFLAP